MSSVELRLAFYGILLAAIAGFVLYERHAGEAEIRAEDKAAADAQHTRDLATNQGIVDENTTLRNQLASSAAAATPAPHLRLCNPPRYVSTGPAAGATQPVIPPAIGSDSGVPRGTQADTAGDIGPIVQDLALAGVLRATNGDLLYTWAVKQASESR